MPGHNARVQEPDQEMEVAVGTNSQAGAQHTDRRLCHGVGRVLFEDTGKRASRAVVQSTDCF